MRIVLIVAKQIFPPSFAFHIGTSHLVYLAK